MKIVFIGTIIGKNKEKYEKIVRILEKTGNKVVADHVMNTDQKDIDSWDEAKKIAFHRNVIRRIKISDIVVAEISEHSTSVGFLLSLAIREYYKPTIVLFQGEKEPNLLSTLEADSKLQMVVYENDQDLEKELPMEVNFAKDQMDVRFNFFVPPQIVSYLDWIAKKRKMPRAVYLRRLIEKDMEKNEDFLSEI